MRTMGPVFDRTETRRVDNWILLENYTFEIWMSEFPAIVIEYKQTNTQHKISVNINAARHILKFCLFVYHVTVRAIDSFL